ncbi:MAG: hypothetical protein IIC53_00635 [Proteobacteria bacterium]|nr:hypothetical protein [Pseudomonadota bacterium]
MLAPVNARAGLPRRGPGTEPRRSAGTTEAPANSENSLKFEFLIQDFNQIYTSLLFNSLHRCNNLLPGSMYELHVCQNGNWKRLKTFEARQEAMSASIEIERARSFSGVKIFELAFDSSAMGNTKKAIHRWTAEADRKVKDREFDDNVDRQKQERQKVYKKRKLESEKRKKAIRNYVLIGGLAVTLILALVTLSTLLGF